MLPGNQRHHGVNDLPGHWVLIHVVWIRPLLTLVLIRLCRRLKRCLLVHLLLNLLFSELPHGQTLRIEQIPHLLQLVPHKYLANYIGIDATNFSKLINSVRI